MKKRLKLIDSGLSPSVQNLIFLLILSFSLANCKTAAPTVELPPELFFIPQALPELSIPIDVGGRSENPEDETGVIRNAFREAYAEALLRDLSLTGVLGSDRVSPWPETALESWSQNWASSESNPNSWGINNLVLALGNYEALAELSELAGKEKAFALVHSVHGPVLDMFGKSAGYSRANGVTGYGIPLGEVVYSNGAAVQRFSRGRMIIAPEGNRFSFQDDSFTSMLENLNPEELEREFGGRNIPREVSNAFIYTWAFVFSEQEGTSDGPIVKVSFSNPWKLEAGEETISMHGFYYKSFNKSQDILVLVESEELPLRAHLLYGSFLKAMLSHNRLPGMGNERRLGASTAKELGKSLADGFAIYGPPLSDPLPLPAAKVQKLSSGALNNTAASYIDENPDILYMEAQRFARGWIVAGSPVKSDEEDTAIWVEDTAILEEETTTEEAI